MFVNLSFYLRTACLPTVALPCTAARSTVCFWPGFVHRQCPSVEFFPTQYLNRTLSLGELHLKFADSASPFSELFP